MDMIDTLGRSFDNMTAVLAGVTSEQLVQPTPCSEWDVRALVGHAMGVVASIGCAVRGEERPAQGLTLTNDLSAQFRSLADATLAGWKARGLEGLVDIGAGPMPAQVALCVNVVDTTTHSWDIARATGQDHALPDPLATEALSIAESFVTDGLRSAVGIYPPVPTPEGASPTDRLVAFMGRQP